MSALDAAAKVLAEKGVAMTCPELIGVMAAKGYWSSPNGKTPAATLAAAILPEITVKGDAARFAKTAPGRFAARRAPGAVSTEAEARLSSRLVGRLLFQTRSGKVQTRYESLEIDLGSRLMSDTKTLPFDDEEFEVPSQPLKRSSVLLWICVGGAACFVVVGFWLIRVKVGDVRRAEEEARMKADPAHAPEEIKLAQERAIAEAKARAGARTEWPIGPSPEQTRNMLPQWLREARLNPLSTDRSWHWSFSGEEFFLQADKGPLPPDLLKAFLGPDQTAALIEGKWSLEGNNRLLLFSELRVDGKAKPGEVKLGIEPEGPKHVKIGDYQYLISEGKP